MAPRTLIRSTVAGLALLAVAACQNSNNAATRSIDRAAGTNTSGAFPAQSDGTLANPSGTAVTRAYDRATDSNTTGAYPQNTARPGTAAQRAYDKATTSDTSGAYPRNR